MQTSEQIGDLAASLAAAQAEMEGASKDSSNPFFKSKYADLSSVRAACVPFLSKHGLAVVQSPSITLTAEYGAGVTVETRLIHKSGQWMAGTLSCSVKDTSPQSVGSAITYLRRYALQSFAGVAPEDDDAEAAHGRPKSAPKEIQIEPDGFTPWLAVLSKIAEEGTLKLQAAWKASKPEHRDYLMATKLNQWEAIKAQAVMADAKQAPKAVRS